MNIIEVFQSFQTQEQAIEHLEKVRWSGEPHCPYCGSLHVGRHASPDRAAARWQCLDCSRPFSVTVGTVFHGTHVPLRDWFLVLALMLGAGACIFAIIYVVPGGLSQILSEASAAGKISFQDLNPATGRLEPVPFGFSLTEKTTLMLVLVGMAQFVSGQLDQDTVQRWCSTKSIREARKSMVVLGFGALPIWTAFMFLGTCLWVYFQHFPSEVSTAIIAGTRKAEDILPHFIVTVLPTGVCGLVASAALAAAMASLSSSINASGMVWVNDLYLSHLVRHKGDAHYVRVARIASLVLAGIMTLGASAVYYTNTKTILELNIILLALVGGGISGAFRHVPGHSWVNTHGYKPYEVLKINTNGKKQRRFLVIDRGHASMINLDAELRVKKKLPLVQLIQIEKLPDDPTRLNLIFSSNGAHVKALAGTHSVSYTHLTLPTNREV